MDKIFQRIWILMIAAALLAGAGCSTTPPPTFYQLEEPASTRLSGLDRGMAIGVGPIRVAPYLNRPHVVTRKTDHELDLSEFNRWAEPLKDGIGIVIEVNLSNMLETTRTYDIPRRDKTIPLDYRVAIDIPRFEGKLGGNALLVARWTLFSREEKPLLTKVSIIEEPTGGEGYERLISAQNRTLQRLSREIVEAIKANS
jgi:uncharacterized lipoprotein YmbA